MNKNKQKHKLKLVYVETNYINYLSTFDRRVMFNKNGNRPYVGIVLHINDVDYFAPLKTGGLDHSKPISRLSTKILDEDNKNKRTAISYILQQYMIPIIPNVIDEIDIMNMKEDPKFKNMLFKEVQFLRKNSDKIIKRAEKVYNYSLSDKPELQYLKNKCLNFKDLADKRKTYQSNKNYPNP